MRTTITITSPELNGIILIEFGFTGGHNTKIRLPNGCEVSIQTKSPSDAVATALRMLIGE